MHNDIIIKREWVKKAGTIFIVVMLILTFFSKTIMNASLPEVSVQNISSGQMNLMISGSGSAQAVSTYEVMLNESRKVLDVHVQQGDKVEVGDVLFTLEKGESEEMIGALDTLDDLNLQYQKMLLSQAESSYVAQDRDITRVTDKLEKAMDKQNENDVSKSELTDAEMEFESLKQDVADLEEELTDLQEELSTVAGSTDQSLLSLKRQIQDKKSQIYNAQDNDVPNSISLDSLETELSRLEEDLAIAQSEASPDDAHIRELNRRIEDKEREIANYSPYIDGPTIDIDQLEVELKRLEDDYDGMKDKNKKYEELTKNIEKRKDELKAEKKSLEIAQKNFEELKKKKEQRDQASEDALQFEQELEDLLFNLEETKKTDDKNAQIFDLDLGALRKDIGRQKEKIAKLREETVDGKITAEKSGIIQSIGITAGGMTVAGSAIAVIETTERGYAVSFPVTKEQSKRLAIGDEAKTDDPKVKGVLSQIKKNPSGSEDERILTFTLNGEVISGEDYAIRIKKTGKKYDHIVPQSAVHSDSKGDFVLVVKSKKTPFGARYNTQKINVEILDRDDEKIAIKGSINESNFVITFSSEPLENGMQIRMTEGL